VNPSTATISNRRLARISILVAIGACLLVNAFGLFDSGVLFAVVIGTLCSVGVINLLCYAWDAVDGMFLITTGRGVLGDAPRRSGEADRMGRHKLTTFVALMIISISIAFLTTLVAPERRPWLVLHTWFLESGVFAMTCLFLQGRMLSLNRDG
jgi:hypothetical protein